MHALRHSVIPPPPPAPPPFPSQEHEDLLICLAEQDDLALSLQARLDEALAGGVPPAHTASATGGGAAPATKDALISTPATVSAPAARATPVTEGGSLPFF